MLHIVIRRNRLLRRFREAGATDPDHAVTFEALGERRSWIFERMAARGVFRANQEGGFYLDERAADFFRQRRMSALLLRAVLVLIGCCFGLLVFFRK